MHAGGESTAVAEHHSVSWAADLDLDSQVILTSDCYTQIQGIVILLYRHYRGQDHDLRLRSEAEARQRAVLRCAVEGRGYPSLIKGRDC